MCSACAPQWKLSECMQLVMMAWRHTGTEWCSVVVTRTWCWRSVLGRTPCRCSGTSKEGWKGSSSAAAAAACACAACCAAALSACVCCSCACCSCTSDPAAQWCGARVLDAAQPPRPASLQHHLSSNWRIGTSYACIHAFPAYNDPACGPAAARQDIRGTSRGTSVAIMPAALQSTADAAAASYPQRRAPPPVPPPADARHS